MLSKRCRGSLGFLGIAAVAAIGMAGTVWAATVNKVHVYVADEAGTLLPDASVAYRLSNGGVAKATADGYAKWLLQKVNQKLNLSVNQRFHGQAELEINLPAGQEVDVIIYLSGKSARYEIVPERGPLPPVLAKRINVPQLRAAPSSNKNFSKNMPPRGQGVQRGPASCGSGGDCCTATPGTPGCADVACCQAVCACDSFCCDTEWDSFCAGTGFVAGCGAEILCAQCQGGGGPCDVTCDVGKLPENEPNCGLPTDTVNGGCNSVPPVFTNINCGEGYCGTGAFDGATRDTDWYRVVLPAESRITWRATAEFDLLIGIVNNFGVDSCAGVSSFLTFATAGPCEEGLVTACLPAGTWYLFVAADFTNVAACGAEYTATLDCAVCGTGACCLPSGTCLDGTSEAACQAQGGTYQGDSSVCSPGLCPQPPANDTCATAEDIAVGGSDLGSTSLANPDGAPNCGTSVDSAGVWYHVVGNGNELTASLCNPGTNYDTKIHVYCDDCVDLACVVGDDDFCGFPPGQSQVTWCSESGRDYFILVEGFGGGTGDFELTLTDGASCTTPPSCEPIQICGPGAGDCCIDNGTPGCEDVACCEAVCAIDPFCCDVFWDGICADEAEQLCVACQGPPCDLTCDPGKTLENEPNCGLPTDTVNGGCNSAPGGLSNCCFANGGPGCDDPTCQAAVCACDSFCCDTEWDAFCAGDGFEPGCGAAILCAGLCSGGGEHPFSIITCGQGYCGSGAFDGASRDTDWYKITLATETNITWCGTAEFDLLIGIVNNFGIDSCVGVGAFLTFAVGEPCTETCVSACLPAGVWYLFVAPDFTSLETCPAEYTATVTCATPCPTGACCTAGVCSQLSQAACLAGGGEYQGDGVACSPGLCPVPPPNDLCANAIPVAIPSSTAGDTTLATIDAGFPGPCGVGDGITSPGVWYSVVGNGSTLTASLCDGNTPFDAKLTVYCPDCTTPTCVTGVDDTCGLQPEVTWCSQAGSTYLILVHGFGAATGPFELDITTAGGACTPTVNCGPVAPTGGCCVGGVCSIQTQAQCTAAGGQYLGDGTACDLPGTVYQASPNQVIPDNSPAGTSHTINVPDSVTINDLNVDLVINHTWVGDLTVSLTHGATTVVLIDRPGVPASTFGCANDNYNIILDDEGAGGAIEALCAVSMVSPPNYTPNNPLSAFDGMNASGPWIITVSDGAAADTGTLVQWSLHLPADGSVCEPVGACCIHPNCAIMTEEDCLAAGGFYLGDDSACTVAGPAHNYVANPNSPIPDNNPAGVSHTINVPDVFTVDDLNVDLSITHTWVGDLTVSLSHNATTVVLVDRPGVPASTFGCANDNYTAIILDDEGTGGTIEALCAVSMTSPPNYTPNNPLSAFDGMAAAGAWIITVSDGAAADTGTLGTWSLHFSSAGTPACEFPGACCNRMTGQCNNNVLEDDCTGDWYKNETCDEITPPCQVCGNGIVEGTEQCDGGICCTATCTYVAAGAVVCRPSAGACDVPESCSGLSSACPPDGFASGATVCRASAGVCDVAENCTGSGVNCPADGFASAATVCRASAGICDVAENCPGNAAGCPADGFVAAGTECRPNAGICDVPEACTGSSAACPADGFSMGNECRPVAGVCDQAESCDGSGAACPADGFLSGVECRASTGECDPAENCTGSAADCPTDATITECGPADGCCPSDTCFSDIDGDVDCPTSAIPTVSEWGLVVLTLLLLVGAKLYFGRQQAMAS